MTMGMARLSNPVQRPGKIREDILGIFDADGKTDEIFGYARLFQIGGGKLAAICGDCMWYAICGKRMADGIVRENPDL